MWKYQETNELYHYGILGQKWGRRRYQYTNGTLTPAGKKHQKEMGWSKDAKYAAKLKNKKVYEMSNEELKKYNERKNLESNYKRLNPSTIKKGAAIVATTGATLGGIVAIKNNGKDIINTGKAIVNNAKYKQLKLW